MPISKDKRIELSSIFSTNVEYLRTLGGLTIKEVCEKSSFNRDEYYKYVHLKRLPTIVNAINLADTLGVSVDFLFTNHNFTNPKTKQQ